MQVLPVGLMGNGISGASVSLSFCTVACGCGGTSQLGLAPILGGCDPSRVSMILLPLLGKPRHIDAKVGKLWLKTVP